MKKKDNSQRTAFDKLPNLGEVKQKNVVSLSEQYIKIKASMAKMVALMLILTSCSTRHIQTIDLSGGDTIRVDKVMLTTATTPTWAVKTGGYIIKKGRKWYLNGRQVELWKYDSTNKKQFIPKN